MSVFITATTDPCPNDKITDYIIQLQDAGVDYIHFDVMDGKFVENKKLGANEIRSELEKNPNIKSVVHLMADEPLKFIDEYTNLGVKYIIVHYEAFKNKADLIACLTKINRGASISGVSLNPSTPLSVLTEDILSLVGVVLIMGVVPGKSGQKMLEGTIEKVSKACLLAKNKFIACDGGINETNIHEVISAGADFISLGSCMYKLIQSGRAKQFVEQF